MEHTSSATDVQELSVGIDVAHKSWEVVVAGRAGELKLMRQPPTVKALVHYLGQHFPGAKVRCAYEAGFCGFWIHEELASHNIDCVVVNPADVPTKGREWAYKSDRIDARKLARGLQTGELDPIYVPSREAQEDRTLVRLRWTLVKKQTRCKNQIKSLLAFYGIRLPEEVAESYWSKAFIKALEEQRLRYASGDAVLRAHLSELASLRQLISQTTRNIRALSREERFRKQVENLSTVPGVSLLTAMTLLTELIDIHRFESMDHLASYAGLAPGSYSSGEREIETGITHRRNAFLRHILIESAWTAVRHDEELFKAFETLSRRMPKQKAIVRIARKLLSRIRFVLRREMPYTLSVK